MKNNFKNHLKLGTLIFGISLLLWNCENEETVGHNHELIQNNTSEFKRISINDLMNNDEIFSELSENYLSNKIMAKLEKQH